jgi:hypothetical protein
MAVSSTLALDILASQKRLVGSPDWKLTPRSGFQNYSVVFDVEIGGGLRHGVQFRVVAYAGVLNSFTFQLDCAQDDVRARLPLYRLDMQPQSPHANKFYGPPEISGLFIDVGISHEHHIQDSLTQDGRIRERGCEQAVILEPAPQDFATALARVCSRINIVNGAAVSQPPSQGALL